MVYYGDMVVYKRFGIAIYMCGFSDSQVIVDYFLNKGTIYGSVFLNRMMDYIVILVLFLVIYLSLCRRLGRIR